jgi:hypothetical protein
VPEASRVLEITAMIVCPDDFCSERRLSVETPGIEGDQESEGLPTAARKWIRVVIFRRIWPAEFLAEGLVAAIAWIGLLGYELFKLAALAEQLKIDSGILIVYGRFAGQ